jgi:CHAD domain-containing protein
MHGASYLNSSTRQAQVSRRTATGSPFLIVAHGLQFFLPGMSYKFKHGETVPQNVKRIANEEIGAAIRHLRSKTGVSRDKSVHEVRKSIKKTRALLRLVRPELGPFFADENSQLRDTGHKLSELRDAGALIGALDNLRKRTNGATTRQPVSNIRQLLTRQKRHLEEEAAAHKLMPNLAGALQQARQSVRYWPLETDGFAAIEAGLEKTFRDGRKALAQARKSGRREDFHEWRKRVKDHWYQVRLLKRLGGDVMEGYERSLKELENTLGEDLNLVVLAERMQSMAAANGNGVKPASLAKAIDSNRKELRERALETGQRVYAEKPREFTRQIRRLWKTW